MSVYHGHDGDLSVLITADDEDEFNYVLDALHTALEGRITVSEPMFRTRAKFAAIVQLDKADQTKHAKGELIAPAGFRAYCPQAAGFLLKRGM